MDVFHYVNVQTLLALFGCFAGCYYYLSRRTNLPPGPWRLPLVGSAIWVFRKARIPATMGATLMEASEEYGDLLYINVLNKSLLFVHGYDAIREFFVTNADTFNNRPHWIYTTMKEEGHRGLTFESGENAKQLRKIILHNLREVGVGRTSLEDRILVDVDAASNMVRETSGEPYDLHDLVHFTVFNVIHMVIFGRRYDYDDMNRHTIQDALAYLFARKGTYDMSNRLPNFILKCLGRDKVKDMNRRIEVHGKIRKYVCEEISKHEDTFDEDSIRDFIDLCIQNKQTGLNAKLFNDDNVVRVIFELFAAGTETTANTILWCIMYMIEHPGVQKKCQDELLEVCGCNDIHWSDKDKLPYVNATIMEVQRMASTGELTMFYTNLEETTMRGYTIPERTLIMGNLKSACMDPKHWDSPDEFRPERFLKDGKLRANPAFIPFSTGPRMCVGESLARMELFLMFTHLLQRFTFRRGHDDVPISFKRDLAKLGGMPTRFKMRAIPRS